MPAQLHEPPKDGGWPSQLVSRTASCRTRSTADETTPGAEMRSPECRAEACPMIRHRIFAARLVQPDAPFRRHRDAALHMEIPALCPAQGPPLNLLPGYGKFASRWSC